MLMDSKPPLFLTSISLIRANVSAVKVLLERKVVTTAARFNYYSANTYVRITTLSGVPGLQRLKQEGYHLGSEMFFNNQ